MPTRKSSAFLRFWILAALVALGFAASARAGSSADAQMPLIQEVRRHYEGIRCAIALQGGLARLFAEGRLPQALVDSLRAHSLPSSAVEAHLAVRWNRQYEHKDHRHPDDSMDDFHNRLELQALYNKHLQSREDSDRVTLRRLDEALTAAAGRVELPAARDAGEVAIVVHQTHWMQKDTAQTLEKLPGLKIGARVLLVSPRFYVGQPELVAQASEIRFSRGGEHGLRKLRAKRIHFFGGFCDGCFSIALEEVLRDFLADPRRKRLEVVMHAALMYRYPFFPG